MLRQQPFAERGVRGEEHAVAVFQPRAGGEIKALPIGGQKAPAADLDALTQYFEPVSFRGTEGTCDIVFPPDDFQYADFFTDMSLHRRGQKALVLSEGKPLGVVAAVIRPFQIGQFPIGILPCKDLLIVSHRRGDIFGAAHAPLDFEGIYPRRGEFVQTFPHRQIGKGERITKFLFARVVKIFLAAGLFATPAVARIAPRERGEIALTRKAGAQSPLHEHFRFDDRRNGFDLPQGRFARQHDAGKTVFFGKPRAVYVIHSRLCGEVQHDVGITRMNEFTQKNILQQNRVRAEVMHFDEGGEEIFQFVVLDEGIHRHVYFHPEKVCIGNDLTDRGLIEVLRARPRGKSGIAQIYGVRAAVDGGESAFSVPRGG